MSGQVDGSLMSSLFFLYISFLRDSSQGGFAARIHSSYYQADRDFVNDPLMRVCTARPYLDLFRQYSIPQHHRMMHSSGQTFGLALIGP